MKTKLAAAGLCLCMIAGLYAPRLFGENVFLRDGSIINGVITKENALTVTVKKKDGKSDTIPRGQIMRILYTQLNLGKIHVQMRNGRNFEAYIVDEDQASYTFRKALTSPQEQVVKRSDVLFIAERNPSGLAGTAETNKIDLTWYPPYNPVKTFRVYMAVKGMGDFRQAAESRRTSHTVRELKSNTAYVFRVTAIDDKGEESLPSNELELATKNIRPNPPGGVTAEKGAPAADGAFPVTLRWQAATDPDGSVRNYRVFRRREGEYVRLAELSATSYTVAGLEKGGHSFGVRAVDDRGDESDIATVNVGVSGYGVTVAGTYILPCGSLSDLFKMGYGVTAAFVMEDVLFEGVEPGIEAGFYWLSSAHYDADGADRDVEHGYMAPAMLRLGYSYAPLDGLSLTPFLAGGISYNSVTYTNRFLVKTTDTGFEPAFSLGVAARFSPWEWWYLHGDCRFTAIAEEDSPLYLIALSLGAGMKF